MRAHVVTADSVAMRVWPMPCVPAMVVSAKRAATSRGRPTSLKISMRLPAPTTRNPGDGRPASRAPFVRRSSGSSAPRESRASNGQCLPEMPRQVSGNRIDVVAAVRTQRQLDMARRRLRHRWRSRRCPARGRSSRRASATASRRAAAQALWISETARQCRTCSEAHGSDDDRETLIGPGGAVNS